jgi:hypothetical protein
MNKKNYGTIPYYDFLSNQRQVCIILILSIICIFFIALGTNKTAAHQKHNNLTTGQTNTTSSLQQILTGCGSYTPVKGWGANIGIKNTNTDGNDFALDDIVFTPVCRKYFDVTFSPYPPKPSITPL